jgi:hypothetical protein
MGQQLLNTDGLYENISGYFGHREDFLSYTDAQEWTKYIDTTSTVASATAIPGGTITLVTAATDTKQCDVHSTNKNFLVAAGKPLVYREIAAYAEANTNTLALYKGFSSAPGTGLIVSGGATPVTSHTGFGFFKASGATTWGIHASLAGAQTNVLLTAANSLDKKIKSATNSATVTDTFEILINPKSTTTADIVYKMNNVTVYKITDFTYTSAVAMGAVSAIRTCSATAETATIDRIDAFQKR